MIENVSDEEQKKINEAWEKDPRRWIFEKFVGPAPCKVKDVSPTVRLRDKNWEKKIDFMAKDENRILKHMNVNQGEELYRMTVQMANGRMVTRAAGSSLEKAVPDPVK